MDRWTGNLKEIYLSISYHGSDGFQGGFDCAINIANIDLGLSAEYASGSGWTFSGRTFGDSAIHMGDLLADLSADSVSVTCHNR